MKTYVQSAKKINKKWALIDADDIVLGKVASTAAHLLRGKHKSTYTPFLNDGDYVIIVNAAKVKLTGNKLKKKKYYKHSGYTGHLKEIGYDELMKKKPEFVVKKAVKGMLSNNRLGRSQLANLRVYSGVDHNHASQNPERYEIN